LCVQGHASTLDADALRMYAQLLDSESIISAILLLDRPQIFSNDACEKAVHFCKFAGEKN